MSEVRISLGLIILNYRTWEKTVTCVQSIKDTYQGDKVIVIVDNKSPNESYDELSKLYPSEKYEDIIVVQTERNGGFSYGNNYGFRYIRDNYPEIDKIIITNNDIIFQENAITDMLKAFDKSDSVVMTAPKIFDTAGNATNIPWKRKPNILQELYLSDCTPCIYTWEELNENVYAYMVSGCCFAVDKRMFDSIGGLDENVFLYNEENIISRKIADGRLKIVYCPHSMVTHDHGSTTGNQSVFVDKEYVKSSLYFFKNYEKLTALQLRLIKTFFILRITLKFVTFRYTSNKGFLAGIKEIVRYR